MLILCCFFFFQAEDGIRDYKVTGVQTCALPISGGEQGGARRVEAGVEQRQPDRKRAGAGLGPVAKQEVADDQHDHERDAADHEERRPILRRRHVLGWCHSEVAKKAMAARNMMAVASQPSRLSQGPLACSPMIALLPPTSITRRRSGGARSPLSTAEKKSMRIGFVPARFSAMPATTAPA